MRGSLGEVVRSVGHLLKRVDRVDKIGLIMSNMSTIKGYQRPAGNQQNK